MRQRWTLLILGILIGGLPAEPARSEACPTFVIDGRMISGLAFEPGALWVTHCDPLMTDEVRISKLDPGSGAILATSPTFPFNGRGLAVGGGSLWIADALHDRVHEIDPSSFMERSSFSTPGTEPCGIAFDGTFLWLTDPYFQHMYKLATTGAVVSEVSIPNEYRTVLEWDSVRGGLWTNTSPHRFARYGTDGAIEETIPFTCLPEDHTAWDLAINGSRWYVSDQSDSIRVLDMPTSSPDRIFLLSSDLNGAEVRPGQNEITVAPGATITGTINLRTENDHGPGAVVHLVSTVSWGDHASSWSDLASVPPGIPRDFALPVNLRAPHSPGTYYMLFGMAEQAGGEWVASMTGSPACPAPIWNDGNDLADLTDLDMPRVLSDGWANLGLWTCDTGFELAPIGFTYIKITVGEEDVLLHEQFDDPVWFPFHWNTLEATFTVFDDKVTGHGEGGDEPTLVYGDPASLLWGNVDFRSGVGVYTSAARSYLRTYFCLQSNWDVNNGYRLELQSAEDVIVLSKLIDGIETVIQECPYDVPKNYGTWIRITLLSGHIYIYIGDDLVIQARDSSYSHGTIGLSARTEGGAHTFIDVGWDDVVVRNPTVENSPDRIFLSEGNLNGTAVNATHNEITVSPGSRITGTLNLHTENDHGPGAKVPLIMVRSWGDHASTWSEMASVPPGIPMDYALPLDLIAPAVPGTYTIVYGMARQSEGDWIASMTSSSYCAAPVWEDGNDLADLNEHDLAGVLSNGWAALGRWDCDSGFRLTPVGLTFVRVVVIEDVPPVAHWRFDEGTGATSTDATGNGHVMTAQNGAAFCQAGVAGSGASLDGNDDRWETPDAPDLRGMSRLTIDAWVNPMGLKPGKNAGVVTHWFPDRECYFLVVQPDGRPWAAVMGSDRVDLHGNRAIPLSRWSRLTMVWDGAKLNLFVDGVPDSSVPAAVGPLKDYADPVYVGRSDFDGVSPGTFWGWIDEVKIYAGPQPCSSAGAVFPEAVVGDTIAGRVEIRNAGSVPHSIKGLTDPGPSFRFSDGFRDSMATGITIPGNSAVATIVVFAPADTGYVSAAPQYRVEPEGFVNTIPLAGRGKRIQLDWGAQGGDTSMVLTIGQTVPVRIRVSEFVDVDSLVLHYASGPLLRYRSLPMTEVPAEPPVTFQAEIPGTEIGPQGLCYFVHAHKGPVVTALGSPKHPLAFKVAVENMEFPDTTRAGMYQMISIPLNQPDNTISGILEDDLGAKDPTRWRMFDYDGIAHRYIEIPNESAFRFKQGQSYWLITKDPILLDTAPVAGTNAPLDRPFEIVLAPGWNMISNPFGFPVPWDSVRVGSNRVGAGSGAPAVEPPYYWDSEHGTYSDSVSVLRPFQGYLVFNESPQYSTIAVPPSPSGIDPRGKSAGRVGTDGKRPVDENAAWRIRIAASIGRSADACNLAGVEPAASNGRDHWDRTEPPPAPGGGISLYFPHGEWSDRSGDLSTDIRSSDHAQGMIPGSPDEATGHLWGFDVDASDVDASPESADPWCALAFSDLASVPADLDILLIDRTLSKSQDLRQDGGYRFLPDGAARGRTEAESRFALIVGSRSYVEGMERDYLSPPLTNSLRLIGRNPAPGILRFRYEVASESKIRLAIYNVEGALVRTLESGSRIRGRYDALWDRRNEGGRPVANGVYFVEMETGRERITRKIVLTH
jgi:hypothetical protein